MRLKTYLKGLGLGIFVTALIMSLGSSKAKGEMSDEEIIARASRLGMVSENDLLLSEAKRAADDAGDRAKEKAAMSEVAEPKKDDGSSVSASSISSNGEIIDTEPGVSSDKIPAETPSDTKTATEKEDETGQAGGKDTSAVSASDKSSSSSSSEKTQPEAASDESAKRNDDDSSEVIVINVNSGESSISVASKMAKAGLVSDAGQFDSYLVLSGYDRHLVVGSHPIPKGASAEEMGRILTSKQ